LSTNSSQASYEQECHYPRQDHNQSKWSGTARRFRANLQGIRPSIDGGKENLLLFVLLRKRGAKNQTEGSPHSDTHCDIMGDNAKQGANAGTNRKPQADSIGVFLWLVFFLFVRHGFSNILILKTAQA
jgi:hypothetical protein